MKRATDVLSQWLAWLKFYSKSIKVNFEDLFKRSSNWATLNFFLGWSARLSFSPSHSNSLTHCFFNSLFWLDLSPSLAKCMKWLRHIVTYNQGVNLVNNFEIYFLKQLFEPLFIYIYLSLSLSLFLPLSLFLDWLAFQISFLY